MASLNDSTIKGFFKSLKKDINLQPGMGEKYRLLRLLENAAGMIEEVYEKDFNLLHPDNALDYKEIIDALNENGTNYFGKKEILELASRFFVPDQNDLSVYRSKIEQLPMKKATGKKTDQTDNLKSVS